MISWKFFFGKIVFQVCTSSYPNLQKKCMSKVKVNVYYSFPKFMDIFFFSDDVKQAYKKVALQHQPKIQNYSEVKSNGLSVEEVENQHKENFQKKLLEEERLQRIEANERLKNKRQQRKNSKEKVCY